MQNEPLQNAPKVENVRVFVRIRPQDQREKSAGIKDIVTLNRKDNQIQLSKPEVNNEKQFKFSKIFDQDATQADLFSTTAVPILDKVLEGYNGTIFAYGQSGTGKTYTMIGHPIKPELKGIVPNIFSYIFKEISMAQKEVSYVVTATYLEIYNEEVRDLLSPNPMCKLQIRQRSDVGVYVKDLLGFTVDSMEGVTDLLIRGNKNRATDCTGMNKNSSRSHAIFTILVESKNYKDNKNSYGKLHLVDLAGSERVKRTLATGDRLKEAGKINLSLSVLGNVISALVDGKTSHVPYRNSKLTRLLQDSLGGNSMTALIALISPSEIDYEESLYTLMYADRVKHIQNMVSINLEKNSVIEKFEMKIQQLQQQLNALVQQNTNPKNVAHLKTKKKCSSSEEEGELKQIEIEKSVLLDKLKTIQKKILIGGENLLEKAEEQRHLLDYTTKELEVLDNSHQDLEQTLEFKSQEKQSVTELYSSLQEEDQRLSKEIEETEKKLSKVQQLLVVKENEYQNEIGTILFANKCLAKEMSLVNLIVSSYIPIEDMVKIKSNVRYDGNLQEWRVKGVAYAGNNIKKRKGTPWKCVNTSTKDIYLDYKK